MIRVVIFLSILLSIDVYIFTSLRHLVVESSNQVQLLFASLYWIITGVGVAYFLTYVLIGTEGFNKNTVMYWKAFTVIMIISKIPILFMLGVDEIRRLIGMTMSQFNQTPFDSSRSRFLTQAGLIMGGIPFASLLYGIIRNPYRYKLYTDTVSIKDLNGGLEGLKIVQISDIHSGSFTYKEPIKNAIKMINDQKPDIVFFTGDLVNSIASEMDPYIDIFDKIESKYGIYSILGNHDYGDYYRWESKEAKVANMDRLETIHKELGWELLRNENRQLDINGAKLGIIGVENISGKMHFSVYGDMKQATLNCPECDAKILLSHDPSHWDKEVTLDYKDIDLTLSGHTHGMQFGIEIPGFIKLSPIQFVYKKWAGLYKEGNQYLYVNRGLGFLGYPGRVGILPEITLLELKSA